MNKNLTFDSTKSYANKVESIMKLFSLCRCTCTPISDPGHTCHTKRASIKRRNKKKFNFIDFTSASHELVHALQVLNGVSRDVSEVGLLQKDRYHLFKLTRKSNDTDDDVSTIIEVINHAMLESNLNLQNETGDCTQKLLMGLC